MLWEVNEHELSDFGMQKKTLEVSPEDSEADFYAQCIDYERELAESCQYDPEFIVRIDELCENYTLDELFSKCDVVSNHLANVPQTVGIFKKEHFNMMKENATFINTGRGAQVCEEDMLSVLEARKDICALLDVTIDEPPVENSKFYTLENVFLTPHIAGSQANEVQRMSELVVDQFENLLNGKETKYEITKEMLAKMA